MTKKTLLAALLMTGLAAPVVAQDAPMAPAVERQEGMPRDGGPEGRPLHPDREGHKGRDTGERADWAFDRLDADGDGAITREEFRTGMERMHERKRDHHGRHDEHYKGPHGHERGGDDADDRRGDDDRADRDN